MTAFIRLTFHSGPWGGREILTSMTPLRFGSDSAASNVVIENEVLSPLHYVLARSSHGEYTLDDVSAPADQSKEALAANSNSLNLSDGDFFRIGTSEIEFSFASPRLVQIEGAHPGRTTIIAPDGLTLGRNADNLLEVTNLETSGYHAVILCTALGLLLEDLQSRNGTFVNEKSIAQQLLADADTIRIGSEVYSYLGNERVKDPAIDEPAARKSARAHFLVLNGPQQGAKISIYEHDLVLGSASPCDFVFQGSHIAPRQCRITVTKTSFLLQHLGSDEPGGASTLVNGEAADQSHELKPGDLLTLGDVNAQFHISSGMSATHRVPQVSAQANFILEGRAEAASSFVIGSSPSAQLQLDGDGIAPSHCTIRWRGAFELEDSSTSGTYLGTRRVVRETLPGDCVIRVGNEIIELSISGDCMTVSLINRQRAMSRIQDARQGRTMPLAAVPEPRATSKGVERVYKTAYLMPAMAEPPAIEAQETDYAPAWRPSTDIDRRPTIKIAVAIAVFTSLLYAFVEYQRGKLGRVLDNHPLSQSHASQLFATQAADLGIADDCRACHDSGDGVPASSCLRCHGEFEERARDGHFGDLADDGRGRPGNQCVNCHIEHNAMPRRISGMPGLLGASRSCSNSGCHPNQHQDQLPKGPPSKDEFVAGQISSFDIGSVQFHASHATVEKEGKRAPIGCTTCHAGLDDDQVLVARDPARSCFGCHEAGGASLQKQCLSCHGFEHGSSHDFTRVAESSPEMRPVLAPLPNLASLKAAALLLFLLSLPLLLYWMYLHRIRGRTNKKIIEKLGSFPVESIKHLVHSINLQKCVGCHACIQACPTNVLELISHKSEVVNFDACIQCGACESSCAFDALVMHDADKPPPTIDVPDLDRGFQTPVAGLYLIGQATGLPQVKNASNMGRSVIESAVQLGLQAGEAQTLGAQVDVAIIGSGPAGLSAALTCKRHGLTALVFEKQADYAWTVRNFYHRGKIVMAEPKAAQLVGYLPIWDTDREQLLAAWQDTLDKDPIEIRCRQKVTNVEKLDSIFQLTIDTEAGLQRITAARVIIAIGGMGEPRKLGCPGDSLDKVHSSLVDPAEFVNQDILVVGGNDSAIEVALALAPHNRVTLSYRGERFDRAKQLNRDRIQEAFEKGTVTSRFLSQVVQVNATSVVLENRQDASQAEFANDCIFTLIGGTGQQGWLQSLGINYVAKSHSWSPPPSDLF